MVGAYRDLHPVRPFGFKAANLEVATNPGQR
jgi:hypothetical protein